MTFLELAQTVLEQNGHPMTADEIWNYAVQNNLTPLLHSAGKTPKSTLSAQLGTSVRTKPGQPFLRTDEKPHRYYLSYSNLKKPPKDEDTSGQNQEEPFIYNERALHPLLSYFVYHSSGFNCVTKTIFQEKSTKGSKGENEWFHPDLVGFYFPYGDYEPETLDVLHYFNQNQYKLYSFEIKKEVTFGKLREYYFQAVSNSSWANQGYLVAVEFSKEENFLDELRRLNSAFGIGVIQLNPEEILNSKVLLPARDNEIDWTTVNRLVNRNPDFRSFLQEVIGDMKAGKYHKDGYDKIYSPRELESYMTREKIK